MTIIIDNQSRHLAELQRLSRPRLTVTIDKWDTTLSQPGELVILSGGHAASVQNHRDHYQAEIDLVTSYRGPILGICLGFEIIAAAFGHKLIHIPLRRGLVELADSPGSIILAGLPTPLVAEAHQWALPTVRPPLIALAESPDGIEVMAHELLPIVGVQFHPEMSPSTTGGAAIYERILSMLARVKS